MDEDEVPERILAGFEALGLASEADREELRSLGDPGRIDEQLDEVRLHYRLTNTAR